MSQFLASYSHQFALILIVGAAILFLIILVSFCVAAMKKISSPTVSVMKSKEVVVPVDPPSGFSRLPDIAAIMSIVPPKFSALQYGKHRVEVNTEDGVGMYKILGEIRRGGIARIRNFGNGSAPVITCRLVGV